MRKHRFYTQQKLEVGSTIQISEEDAHHARNVLRLSQGDIVYIFNGLKECKAEIISLSKRKNSMLIKNIEQEHTKSNYQINICIPLIKSKQFELALEKLTEVGVNKIIPVEFDYSVVKVKDTIKKRRRWQKIIESAAKQSGRLDIPELLEPIKFKEVIDYAHVIAFIEPSKAPKVTRNLIDPIQDWSEISILIGPEGGYSHKEIEQIEQKEIITATLPMPTLRTETAAIVTVGIITNYIHR